MRRWILALVAVLALSACGKSEQQKEAEKAADDLKKAAEAMAEAAESQGTATAAQGAADMAKAMQGMAAALNGKGADGKPVEPVAFQTLQAQLPKVPGWEMEEPEGERMNMPVAFSQAQATYKKGESRITAKIVDTGFAQMLVAPWSMMLATGFSRESSNGYEKATSFSGNPAIEKWDKKAKDGELDVLVGKRFMVTLEGHDLDDIKQLQDFASKVNFGAIASTK